MRKFFYSTTAATTFMIILNSSSMALNVSNTVTEQEMESGGKNPGDFTKMHLPEVCSAPIIFSSHDNNNNYFATTD